MSMLLPARRSGQADHHPQPGAIDKAMLVLECVSRRNAPAKLSEIARSTGLPKSTVHRLLATLEAHGALRRMNVGYVLGDMIRRLSDGGAGTTPTRDALRRLLMPHVAEVYEATHLPTSLAVLDELTVVCLITIYPRSLAEPVLHSSERIPAHRTALGRLLLAYSPPACAGARHAHRPVERELAGIRAAGIACHPEEHLGGMTGMAVPITDRFTGVAAIGIAGPAGEPMGADVEAMLRRTAHEAYLTLRRHRARPA